MSITKYTTEYLHMPTALAIEKYMGISPKALIQKCKDKDRATARHIYAYIRLIHYKRTYVVVARELCRNHPTLNILRRRGVMDQTIKDNKEVYDKIIAELDIKEDDILDEQASESDTEVVEQLPDDTPSTYTFNEGSQYCKAHNFKFTNIEDKAISAICQEAELFMRQYGKGTKIAPINVKKYANNDNTIAFTDYED